MASLALDLDLCYSHRGKIPFQSRAMARLFLRKAQAKGKGTGVEVYRCVCGGWFLGRLPPRAVRARLKREGRWR